MNPKSTHHEDGQIEPEERINEDGEYHNVDGPAIRRWYDNGQLSCEEWRVNGLFHRLDGPALRWWYKRGRLEREAWYINGNRHRLDGPAFRSWYGDGHLEEESWYINGVRYETEAEFQVAVDLYKANEIAELF